MSTWLMWSRWWEWSVIGIDLDVIERDRMWPMWSNVIRMWLLWSLWSTWSDRCDRTGWMWSTWLTSSICSMWLIVINVIDVIDRGWLWSLAIGWLLHVYNKCRFQTFGVWNLAGCTSTKVACSEENLVHFWLTTPVEGTKPSFDCWFRKFQFWGVEGGYPIKNTWPPPLGGVVV